MRAEGDDDVRDNRLILRDPAGREAGQAHRKLAALRPTYEITGDRDLASVPGAGSVSAAAAGYGRQHGITVIDGGCPLMFGPTADLGHKIMRLVYAGHVPKQV